jgi:hypothetical protein
MAMIYIAILTDRGQAEVSSICEQIGERITRFVDDYPDREHTFVEPWPETPAVYVRQARRDGSMTPEIEHRLKRCKTVLYFEGPGNPQECADQVSVLKLYLEALDGSVVDWGGIDYGWPLVQLGEDALRCLRQLPDEPRLSSEALR